MNKTESNIYVHIMISDATDVKIGIYITDMVIKEAGRKVCKDILFQKYKPIYAYIWHVCIT